MQQSRLLWATCFSALALTVGCAQREVYIEGYSEARSSHERQEYAKAIEQYQAYVAEHPESPLVVPVTYQIAECNEALGKTDQAVAHYRKVIELQPDGTWARASKDKLARLARTR